MQTNTTPTVRKQTVWFQLLTFVALLIDLISGNNLIAGYFGGEEGTLLVMAGNIVAIGLSFTKPISQGHLDNLKKLEVDEHESDDDYRVK